jgi:DDE superfamily endonuclease
MTERLPCPAAPGPLESYAAEFDPLFGTLAQRHGFREYLQGLLLPRDRNKTLTALAGAEPVVAAQSKGVQRLQFFLSESPWDAEVINTRRLALLLSDPATVPHAEGVLVIDDSGDRKAGSQTAHVARQWLGSIGKVDNGIVAVSSLWADERVYYPLHVRPYTPGSRLPKGKKDPAFRTKPQLALELIEAALATGVPFRAVVADCAYGDNVNFEAGLWDAGLPYVVSLKPSKGTWAMADQAHTPEEAARRLRWRDPAHPGDWTRVERRFRDGHTQTWYAADLTFSGYGPERLVRLLVATTDPATLPAISTWYLTTNLPCPGSGPAADSPHAPADLTEVVRLYGLRNWVEQGYKQVKDELGWADFMVRSDRAIRRHWQLVCCAFSFCWRAWFAEEAGAVGGPGPTPQVEASAPVDSAVAAGRSAGRGENGGRVTAHFGTHHHMADGPATRARVAGSVDVPLALVASVVNRAPTAGHPGAPARRRHRPSPARLSPGVTNYR